MSSLLRILSFQWPTPSRIVGHGPPSVLDRYSELKNEVFSGLSGKLIQYQYESRRFNGRRPADPSDAALRSYSIAPPGLESDDSGVFGSERTQPTTSIVDSIADAQPSRPTRHSKRTRSLLYARNLANPWQMRQTHSIQVRISSIQWPTPSRRIRGATPTALDRYPELGNGRFLGRSDGYIPF